MPDGLKAQRKAREIALQADPDTLQWIAEAIERGEDFCAWCQGKDISYSRMMAWVESDPERALVIDGAYRARAALAAGLVETMARRLVDPEADATHPWLPKRTRTQRDDDGNPHQVAIEIDSKAARVAMAGFQWTAEKHHRERFGKVTEHKHTHSVQFEHLQAMRAFSGRHVPGARGAQPGALQADPMRAQLPALADVPHNRSAIPGLEPRPHAHEARTLDGECQVIEPNALNDNVLSSFGLAWCLSVRRTLTRTRRELLYRGPLPVQF